MKRNLSLSVTLLTVVLSPALASGQIQSQLAGSTAEVGPHHRVLRPATDALRPVTAIARSPVVELATGMNYWDGEVWKTSEPVFDATRDAYVATRVHHRIRLSAEINTVGAVTMSLPPDGQLLYSTPVAIAYRDRTLDRVAVIGVLTNSTALLASSNQVVYPSAFHGVCIDIWYTLSQSDFHQDIVFTGKLEDPAVYGFSTSSTEIQILTECYNAPQPQIEETSVLIAQDPALTARGLSNRLVDQRLQWGDMVFGQGHAYSAPTLDETNGVTALITKQFQQIENRWFLVETIQYADLQAALEALPDCAPPGGSLHGALPRKDIQNGYASLPVPPEHVASASTPFVRPLVKLAALQRKGVTADYLATLTGSATLQCDTTYLVSGTVNGSITVEGGAVVKYKSGASLNTHGQFMKRFGSLACGRGGNG